MTTYTLIMRVIILKLYFWLYVAMTVNSIGDHNSNIESKNAYIESELKRRLSTNSHQNRYATLLMANSRNSLSSSSTTQRSPWLYQPSSSKYSYSNLNSVHLRHSKHPSLDAVLTRLDKLYPRHTVTTTTTTTTPATPTPKYRYQKYSSSYNLFTEDESSDEFFDYDDDVDNDNLPDYDTWDSAKEDEDEEEDDEDGGRNIFYGEGDWQAEEATTTPLSSYKSESFGTKNKFITAEHSDSNLEMQAAIEHTRRMNSHRCHNPLPRVVSVQNVHPDPAKSYTPHCTVLHRCSADTGCCSKHSKTCAPKSQTDVYLYFYTTTLGIRNGYKIEKLRFINHTECECVDESVQLTTVEPRTTEASRDGIRSHRSSVSVRAADSPLYPPETIRRCKCPEEYNSMLDRENRCSCDCAENNKDCIRFKKGEEFFSYTDRECITNDECGIPKCEYGPFIRSLGRCPKKQEKLNAFASVSRNFT